MTIYLEEYSLIISLITYLSDDKIIDQWDILTVYIIR